MERTLVAERPLFYRKRALVAGQAFMASHVDADYLVRKGDALLLPMTVDTVPPAFVPPAAVVDVAATPTVEVPAADPLSDPHEGLTFHDLSDSNTVSEQSADAGAAPAEPADEAAAEIVSDIESAAAEQPEADTVLVTTSRRGGQTRRRHNSTAE